MLIFIQFIIGSKARFEMTNPELSTDMFWLKRAHRYLGTFMSLIGKVIVGLMLFNHEKNLEEKILFRSWLFVVGALLFLFVIF